MSNLPSCPQCHSQYIYEDGTLFICPECSHEWSKTSLINEEKAMDVQSAVRDAHGNVLSDGDMVTVIKDLKVKGSSSVVKVGTKVKIIRLVEGDHDIDCKIEGMGSMQLKSEYVKKVLN
ncbi:zinc ribbon domain-containing protein YjdM [Silvanigrella aquatica]|uniref:Alkylphosphonate utilization protein n=1 Tax=Silvanigrella aquatica TaxID=1915309 RepID=A0A1L4D2U6_9BACT|nr:zinc ribbon domain-containing protein YjdM [Silvanigrella aquatica]APJ04520.1 alkylphosphonate utilization protein [Silvanigrella aquatica]